MLIFNFASNAFPRVADDVQDEVAELTIEIDGQEDDDGGEEEEEEEEEEEDGDDDDGSG